MNIPPSLWIAIVVAASIVGLVLLVMGVRGRRIGDHPHCARCEFDLYGLDDETSSCPECGRNRTRPGAVRIGARRRRPAMAALGTLLILGALGVSVAYSWGQLAGFDWNTVKPVWLLLKEVRHDEAAVRQAALDELFNRRVAGALSRDVESRLQVSLLDLQADPAVPWDDAWGQYLYDSAIAGGLELALFDQFLENGAVYTLDLRSPVRTDSDLKVWLRVEGRGADNTGLWTRFVRTSFLVGETEYVRRSGGYAEMPFSSSGGSSTTITLTNPPGTYPVTARWQMTVRDGDQEVHSWAVERKTTIEVTDETGDPITLTPAPDLIDEIRSGITVRGVRIHPPDAQGGRYIESTVHLKNLPINVAFDVFWRINEREWNVGQAAVAAHQTHGFGQHKRLDDLPDDVDAVTIVMRASEDAARRTTDLTEIWDGEIVIDNVPVESSANSAGR